MKEALEYYGVIDRIERVVLESGGWHYVLVDCIATKGLEELFLSQPSSVKLIDIIDKLELELLLLRIPDRSKDTSLRIDRLYEGRWLKISSSNHKSEIQTIKLSDLINGTDNPPNITSESFFLFLTDETQEGNFQYQILDGRTSLARRLRDGHNLAIAGIDFVDQTKAESKLSAITPSEKGERNVTCYNVGQGNAVCIGEKVDNNASKPLLYFDIGGGANFNTFTYPANTTRNFKVEENTLFILSHWDEDHYETAKRDNNLVNTRTYIAPVQIVTPRNLKFVKRIIDQGELILLPKTFTSYNFTLGTLERCLGQDLRKKNDCGLILRVELNKTNDISTILLPGDAQYHNIPSVNTLKFDAILATHHGGKLYDPAIIPCTTFSNGCIAYSYGDNNIYKHPNLISIKLHESNGWGVNNYVNVYRNDTINGDIIFKKIKTDLPTCSKGSSPVIQFYERGESLKELISSWE